MTAWADDDLSPDEPATKFMSWTRMKDLRLDELDFRRAWAWDVFKRWFRKSDPITFERVQQLVVENGWLRTRVENLLRANTELVGRAREGATLRVEMLEKEVRQLRAVLYGPPQITVTPGKIGSGGAIFRPVDGTQLWNVCPATTELKGVRVRPMEPGAEVLAAKINDLPQYVGDAVRDKCFFAVTYFPGKSKQPRYRVERKPSKAGLRTPVDHPSRKTRTRWFSSTSKAFAWIYTSDAAVR